MKVIIATEVVVAKKGTKGFIKTRKLTDDANFKTTIVDIRIERTNNFKRALELLNPKEGLPMPVRLILSQQFKDGVNVPEMNEVIKFIRTSNINGSKIEGVLSGNYNNYTFKYDCVTGALEIKLQETMSTTSSVRKTNVVEPIHEAKIINLLPRYVSNVVSLANTS